MTRLFVANLPFSWSGAELEKLFAEFGNVCHTHIVKDAMRNSRGFGFVEIQGVAAEAVIAGLKGKVVEGRRLDVTRAAPRKE